MYLQNNNIYQKPKFITMDHQVQNIILNNINTIDTRKIKGLIFSLKFQKNIF